MTSANSSDELTPSQRKAVFHIDGPLLVLAGPGSGKTRIITNRIAALIDSGINPHNICAITFTNRAAEEMRQRALSLVAAPGTHISTFHSLCARLLRTYADKMSLSRNFSIYNESDQRRCMTEAIKACEFDTSNFPPARILEAVSLLKNKLEDLDALQNRADDFFTRAFVRIYARYQQILAENNALDFDDLLTRTAFLLTNFSDVRSELNNHFKFLLIDEYQDTNYAQYVIARHLAVEHNNICVTGDPDQSIYRWRGADISNILAFEKDWPGATVVMLEENFRSGPDILAAADSLISANRIRKPKKLIPTQPEGRVLLNCFADDTDEALQVAEQIHSLISQGTSPGDIAVFYRVNAMSRLLEEAFIQSKIPYQVVRGVEFYNRKEIRDIIAYLKVLVNPRDRIALLRIINTPARGIGKTTLNRLAAFAERNNISFYEALQQAHRIESLADRTKARLAGFLNMLAQFRKDTDSKVAPLMERIYTESGMQGLFQAGGTKEQTAAENVSELINSAHLYDAQAQQPSLADYLQQVSLFSDSDAYDSATQKVCLMTLHSAKGLEFENVFIIGLQEGLLPHERASACQEELEEERRLFFVGITRAKKFLHISYTQHRTLRGQLLRTMPSQFLFELGIELPEPKAEPEFDYDTAPGRTEPLFLPGQLVRHDSFGLGRVRQFIDMGQNSVVVVEFNTGQTKTLMLKYAGLSKVD